MSEKLPVHALISGLFTAPPEKVFDAFLDTEMIGRFMFGPGVRDEEIVRLTNEPRVGGSFSYIVRREGREIEHRGQYLALQRPGHMIFTWGVNGEEVEEPSQVVIDIAPIINGCELTLDHRMPAGYEEFVEKGQASWGLMLDKLAEAVR